MSEIPTVAVGELAPACPLAEALGRWSGFVQLVPASRSRPLVPHLVLNEPDDAAWQWGQTEAEALPPVGCSFLHDIEISGSGYLFHHGRFVREFVNISDTALRWLGQPDLHDNPLTRPRTNHVVIEDPVLMMFGPGSSIYGHWLLDFLPRIFIAQQLLGSTLDGFVLPLPSDSPAWVAGMIHTFCGIAPERIIYYSRNDDLLVCRRVCLPGYAHSGKRGDYAPHPLMRTLYDRFGNAGGNRTRRRICLSRRGQEAQTYGKWRIFELRETMEQMAVSRGFEIVQPEMLSFRQQVELFRSADCILGEHGSGMHAAVFADPNTIIATVGAWNRHQVQIAACFGHRLICMKRHQVIHGWEPPRFRFTVTEPDLIGMFAMIDTVRTRGADAFGGFAPTAGGSGDASGGSFPP